MNAKKIPMRKCIGCNEMFPKKELIRILNTPDDEIILDVTGKKNGRGAYLCRKNECLEKAFKTKGINRSFGKSISDEVYNSLRNDLKVIIDEE